MNLTIKAQLIGGFAVVVGLLIAVFGVSFWGMNSMGSATDEIVHVDVPAELAVKDIEKLVLDQTIFYADYAITRDAEALSKINHDIEEIEATIGR